MLIPPIPQRTAQVLVESTRAALTLERKPARLTIKRERGGYEMQSHPIKLDIDNRAFFDSMGLKSLGALAGDLIARGKKAALESTARYAREGNLMASPDGENAISEIALMRTRKSIETMLVFIPDPPEMSWTGGWTDISFTPDKLDFSWDTGGITKTYMPYSIRFTALEGSAKE